MIIQNIFVLFAKIIKNVLKTNKISIFYAPIL